ncbi:uncharacterized protein LOC130753660 [Actinidia eriantha]|uniref:uncharacterized protein LOC130753660 n=1 Tax=Actinidia eriantha TaxID=165200 RepID=UPI00258B0D36|nr:uncharacterized protein LOC130753660 [Actinidia eriantha]
MEVDGDVVMDVVMAKYADVVVAKAKEEEDNVIMRKEVKIFKQIEVVEEGITPTEDKEKTNFVESKGEEIETTVLLAYESNEGKDKNTWYLDTGASNHMCGDKGLFVELGESIRGKVSFGDLSKVPVKGRAARVHDTTFITNSKL